MAQIQERQKDAAETADARRELTLVTNPLEDFATKVRAGLNTLNWLGTRDIIRTLVRRIEIDGDDIEVAFRVPPPGGSAPLRPVPLAATLPTGKIVQAVIERTIAWRNRCRRLAKD